MADRRKFFTVSSYLTESHAVRGILSSHKRGGLNQIYCEVSVSILAEKNEVVVAHDNLGNFQKAFIKGTWHGSSTTGFLVQE